MKKTITLLLVAGLLIGTVAGLAFAFGGDAGTGDADVKSDDDAIYEPDDANAADKDDAIYQDDIFSEDDIFFEDEEAQMDCDNSMIPDYFSVTGTVESVEKIDDMIRVTIEDTFGNPAVLVLSEDTVYPFAETFEIGDVITGWYVTNAPMIAIWPPQYNIAVLVADAPEDSNITVDRFNAWEDNDEGFMLSQDGKFAFRTDENTVVTLANGDDFTNGDIAGRRIVVIYDVSTRSIPEMATALKLIVLYEDIVPLGW